MKMKYKLTDLQMGFPSHYVEDEEDSIYFSSLANVECFLADRHEHIVGETDGEITQKEWEEMKLEEMISLFGYKLELINKGGV